MLSGPSDEQALQFAIMLQAGLPAEQAILYFTESDDPATVHLMLQKWTRSRAVQSAQKTLLGKSWQEMSLDEKIDTALNQHYAALAFLLFSTNYVNANQGEKAKLDSARGALEAKKAGVAGKGDALSMFFDDVKSGRIKLNSGSTNTQRPS